MKKLIVSALSLSALIANAALACDDHKDTTAASENQSKPVAAKASQKSSKAAAKKAGKKDQGTLAAATTR